MGASDDRLPQARAPAQLDAFSDTKREMCIAPCICRSSGAAMTWPSTCRRSSVSRVRNRRLGAPTDPARTGVPEFSERGVRSWGQRRRASGLRGLGVAVRLFMFDDGLDSISPAVCEIR